MDICDARTGRRIGRAPPMGVCTLAPVTGRFYVLDLETGEKALGVDTGAPLSASPAIADGKVVIGSQDGVLYCFG